MNIPGGISLVYPSFLPDLLNFIMFLLRTFSLCCDWLDARIFKNRVQAGFLLNKFFI